MVCFIVVNGEVVTSNLRACGPDKRSSLGQFSATVHRVELVPDLLCRIQHALERAMKCRLAHVYVEVARELVTKAV